MPEPRIYVDTTIPSAYHTNRTDPGAVERRADTRLWWHLALQGSELLISRAVLKELSRGRAEEVVLRLALAEDLEVLRSSAEIASTADAYIRRKLMPHNREGDALHLALASHHGCNTLVTWNYHHLANPNKLDRIGKLNEERGSSSRASVRRRTCWRKTMIDDESHPDPLDGFEPWQEGESHDSFVERARAHHARTGQWPPDPLLDEVAEMRRRVMAEHGNDYRKVLQWYVDMDDQAAPQEPESEKGVPDQSAGVSRP